MKKNVLFLGLASMMLAFAGCTKDVATDGNLTPEGGDKTPMTLIANVDNGADTRTSLADDKISMLWSDKDDFAVFSHNTTTGGATQEDNFSSYFSLTQGAGTSTGVFVKDDNFALTLLPIGTDTTVVQNSRYIAIYPFESFQYQSYGYPTKNRVGVEMPAVQPYLENNFDAKAAPMIAGFKTEDAEALNFKFFCSMIHLPVKALAGSETTLMKVEVAANDTDQIKPRLSGRVFAQFLTEGYFEATPDEIRYALDTPGELLHKSMLTSTQPTPGSSARSVTLQGPIAISEGEVTDLYVGILPENIVVKEGIALKFFYEDGSSIERTLKIDPDKEGDVQKVLQPGTMYNVPEFTLGSADMPKLTLKGTTLTAPEGIKTVYFYQEDGTPLTYKSGTDFPQFTLTLEEDETTFDLQSDSLRTKLPNLALFVDNVIISSGTTGKLKVGVHKELSEGGIGYSAFVPFDYTPAKKVVAPIQATVTNKSGDALKPQVLITNWWDGGYEVGSFAFIAKAKAETTEADFATATFTPLKFGAAYTATNLVGGTTYTFMIRASTDKAIVSEVVAFVEYTPAAKAPELQYGVDENGVVFENIIAIAPTSLHITWMDFEGEGSYDYQPGNKYEFQLPGSNYSLIEWETILGTQYDTFKGGTVYYKIVLNGATIVVEDSADVQ